MKKSKGVYEAEISKAITQWEKDYLGRGSLSVKTDILRDMVIINLQGILTPAEYRVCETNEGLLNIKGIEVVSFHSDLSTVTGERVIVFKLKDNFEKLINQA